eukprot:TRINITY_DN24955_c0_g1_i2.p2 TRINITY_DN24955_c0_g1~~TRINITY_DN24955_c0_g1_i2.p2  ORF type:complete len:110 (-),score=13.71 TRINITY_DN24955_c0_g1_i2:452-781(-)
MAPALDDSEVTAMQTSLLQVKKGRKLDASAEECRKTLKSKKKGKAVLLLTVHMEGGHTAAHRFCCTPFVEGGQKIWSMRRALRTSRWPRMPRPRKESRPLVSPLRVAVP